MLPKFIRPMLAVEAREPFDSDDHIFEIKWDGIRCIAFVGSGQVRLQSRELVDITAQFPELTSLAEAPDGTVMDGELVAFQEGRPCLARVQQRVHLQDYHRISFRSRALPVVLVAFDLLYVGGQSIMGEPLFKRRAQLEGILCGFRNAPIVISEDILTQGRDLFSAVRKLGLEGIMAKSLNGQYTAGRRTLLWKKVKVRRCSSS